MREVKLALIICTYRRRTQLMKNLERIFESRFFAEGDEQKGKLHIYVVDNARELKLEEREGFFLIPNRNNGGSGGFRRGMGEVRKNFAQEGYTNVILMDDDVDFVMESLYRIYAVLSHLKPEHEEDVIAGRMFRTDDRKIQYTAAEIWNRGNLHHVGLNRDMTKRENLKDFNSPVCAETGESAEYGGWWMACFPMGFILENDPLPFFLHCDDVEYGLRHGGTPIIWNGVQVWHETYEYRQTPVMEYFDSRNSKMLNRILGKSTDIRHELDDWRLQIGRMHAEGETVKEYVFIKAFEDSFKGLEWLKKKENAGFLKKLIVNFRDRKGAAEALLKIYNKFYWRVVWIGAILRALQVKKEIPILTGDYKMCESKKIAYKRKRNEV